MPITGLRCLFFIFKTAQKPDLILTHIFKTLKMLQVVNVFRTNHFRLMALKLFFTDCRTATPSYFCIVTPQLLKREVLVSHLSCDPVATAVIAFLLIEQQYPPPPSILLWHWVARGKEEKNVSCVTFLL